jgi:hypothetical protein
MRRSHALLSLAVLAALWPPARLVAQDLAPRAYVVTPIHTNAVTLTWSYYNGGLDLSGAIPVNDAKGVHNVSSVTLYHSFNFFGRTANVTAFLPYAVGNFTGELFNEQLSVYRSGLLDFGARVSVNLYGGQAMELPQFAKWKQKVLLGASLKLVAPTGQYDPRRLINWGINRWAFKPEFGYSERWGHVVVDGYAGVWLYTTNPSYYGIPTPQPQTEAPIGSLEGHLSYDFSGLHGFRKTRAWASLDGNFWWGGITALNGIRNLATKQTSSRIGVTVSLPYSRHQSIKIAFSDGAYIRFGGNYNNVSVAWQYSWIGRPR